MQAEPSRLTIEATGDHAISVAGIVDAHTAEAFGAHLQALGTDTDVVLDMASVEFIDSSGLRSLVDAHQALEAAGHRLQISAVSAPVQRLLEITSLDDHLHLG